MTHRKLAETIIDTLTEHTRESTWGENNTAAHAELFGDYREDMVLDVERMLLQHGKDLCEPQQEGSML